MQAITVSAAQDQLVEAQLRASQSGLSRENVGGLDRQTAREVAEQFEAVFLSQMLAPMFNTLPTDGLTGGGHAEEIYRGMMVEEIGKQMSAQGGIGIADSVFREIIKLQEG